jgi:hypothetical protein
MCVKFNIQYRPSWIRQHGFAVRICERRTQSTGILFRQSKACINSNEYFYSKWRPDIGKLIMNRGFASNIIDLFNVFLT